MMTPDVSILIPVYNEEVYLPRCLDSIVGQTLQSWELLLVDDGSTDRSGSICDSYAARDSRIRVIHQENAGISAARNAGLAAAAGKYIGFVDSDDWIAPEMFQRLLTIAGETDCPLVMCDARTVYADGRSEPDTITQLKSSCLALPVPCGAASPARHRIPTWNQVFGGPHIQPSEHRLCRPHGL